MLCRSGITLVEKKFPQSRVEFINAGVVATDSVFGAARVDDVKGKGENYVSTNTTYGVEFMEHLWLGDI